MCTPSRLPLLLSLLASCVPLEIDDTAAGPVENVATGLDLTVQTSRMDVTFGETAREQLDKALALDRSRRIGLVLDRPLYAPGETVWVRVFDLDPETFRGTASGDVNLTLVDGKDQVAASARRPLDAGDAHIQFELSSQLRGGAYTLRVEVGGQTLERPLVVTRFEPPRIRKTLDLLREAYGPGDEVTASVSVATAGGGPLLDHPIDVLVQVGGQALPVKSVHTDLHGQATVRFELPDDLDRSDVLLTVLVTEGGLRESISRAVPIVLDAIDIDWYPEGGDLVTGLPSRMYLQAKNAHGEPADLAGVVIDDRGREITSFRTLHDGLGRFPLTPQEGRRYHVRITEPSALAGRTYHLPEPRPDGCVLQAVDDPEARSPTLAVAVHCTEPQHVVVTGSHRQRVLDSAVVHAGPDGAVVHLEADDPALDRAQGVARVTLLDEELLPLAERLVYRNRSRRLKVSIEPDKAGYGPRDEVVLKVTTRDPDGRPVAADLALSVVDDRLLKLADDENGELLTQLYLDPWLQGHSLKDPSWYFDPEEPEAGQALDLVMGTYGHRRFERVPVEGAQRAAEEAPPAPLDRPNTTPDGGLGTTQAAGILGALLDDGSQVWGGVFGMSGEAAGLGGLGTRGVGRGGGGRGGGMGSGYGYGGGNFGAKGLGGAARAGQPIILGSLDRDSIQRVIRRHMNQIRYCYQRELVKNPDLAGKVSHAFVIESSGHVSSARTKSSTLGSEAVEACVNGRLLRMRFPEPAGGGIVIVSYPFLFTPDGGSGSFTPATPSYASVRTFPVPDYRSEPPPQQRTDFRSTVFWAPSVQTGANGSAEVRFTLNDAVTTFTATAEGVGAGEAGRGTETLDSTLPFAMDVPIPEEVSFGDRLLLPVRLTNRRGEDVQVTIDGSFGDLLRVEDGMDHQQIALAGQGAQTTIVPLLVGQGQGEAEVQIVATGASIVDAVSRTLSVVPRGFPTQWSASGALDTLTHHTVEIGEPLPESSSGELTIYPSALTNLLDGMADMVRLPGGCFEQTSSSNYPNILVMQSLDRTGRGGSLRIDRHTALSTGYRKLTGYQISAGGFETFGSGPGKEVLSAYGLLQFTDMKAVWPSVDDEMLQRDIGFLFDARNGRGGYDIQGASSHNYGGATQAVNDAFITHALVSTGHTRHGKQALDVELIQQAELAKTTDDPYLLALATRTLQHTDPTAGEAAIQRLLALQDPDGTFPHSGISVVGSRGNNLLVETTALATLALLGSDTHHPAIERAASWLLTKRGTYGWGSTQATVLALKALDEVALGTEIEHGSVTVRVDGEPVGTLTWSGTESAPLTLDLSPWLTEGTHVISLAGEGANVPYALAAEWSTETPANAAGAPLLLETKLMHDETRVGEPVRFDVRIENITDAVVGSPLARVRIPAGTRVETRQLQQLKDRGDIAHFEIRAREVTLYWEGFAPAEARTIGLDLIPEVPGTFTAPPSSVYPYYDGDQVTWAAGPELRVTL